MGRGLFRFADCFGCQRLSIDIFAALCYTVIERGFTVNNCRKEQGITQKELEELSGVKPPVIARMEKEITNPRLDTILKVLVPLGKTLAVVPLEKK